MLVPSKGYAGRERCFLTDTPVIRTHEAQPVQFGTDTDTRVRGSHTREPGSPSPAPWKTSVPKLEGEKLTKTAGVLQVFVRRTVAVKIVQKGRGQTAG